MLGLLLLYFIGKSFYQLAYAYDKSGWGFALVGILSYYVGTFIGGLIIAIPIEVMSPGSIESADDFLLAILSVPFGLLGCWGVYRWLKSRWEGSRPVSGDYNILDEGLTD